MVDLANAALDEPQELPFRRHVIPLRELLNLRCLERTAILAGEGGLDRAVSAVNVMEVPDVLDWVKPQELLVTTGYPLATGNEDPAEMLTELVPEFHHRKLAGIGIKLGRYLDTVPERALALADELDFPVLRLPLDLAFDDLIEQTFAQLGQRQADALSRADTLHTSLSRLILNGADLDQISAEVARVLGVSIVVTSTDGREWGGALEDGLRERLADIGLLDNSGRFRVERLTTGPYPLEGGEARVLPVPAGGNDLARLVCVSPHRVLGFDDVQALERTAIVVALLLTRQQAVAVVENKYRGDFLRDVFLDRAGDEAFVIEHARTFGWELDRPTVVLSAELDPLDPTEEPVSDRTRRLWQERFAAAWRQVCEARDRSIATVDFSTEVVSLLPASLPADSLRTVVDQLVGAVAGDQGGGRRPFSVGVSRVVSSVSELPHAYNQARRAAKIGRRINGGRCTTWFDDLGLHRLIALVPDPQELREFVDDMLGELAADTPEAADLRTTLQLLLDTNLNVAEAARKQFFHYNTMRYRITKLQAMLGPFTTDPVLRLNIAVALQVLDFQHCKERRKPSEAPLRSASQTTT
ncbi:PucR family transcriptional regulator [Saccharomonospora viridis]|jgi:PucR family transcriptional regulator, purine catabolism regulatory protein|nr:PucR family transcriptional regulator [Saccharomonospora viridis]SFO80407.1 purine catabolism regulatory protein [Saccharomonospora viridis]